MSNSLENDANMSPQEFSGQTDWEDPTDASDGDSIPVVSANPVAEIVAEVQPETPIVENDSVVVKPTWVRPGEEGYDQGVDVDVAETRPRGRRPQVDGLRVLMVADSGSGASTRSRRVAAPKTQVAGRNTRRAPKAAPKAPQTSRGWQDIADELRDAEDRVNSLRAELVEALG